jgi:hypothetical protein
LSKPFLDYLRADGIVLPSDEEDAPVQWSDRGNSIISGSASSEQNDDDDEDEDEDVAAQWRDIHVAITKTIAELGGSIVPKLNWSAPKDATWMNSNTMACRLPSEVYLLLKSSDFVTHDLEHAFDDCVDSPESTIEPDEIPYALVLRKTIEKINPSLEFRCFVRGRKLLAICQRDLNHYKFLFPLQDKIRAMILEFFAIRLRDVFPDEDFVFDVYIPPPHDRVWLIDFNPWAPRTDPLLFGWLELLTMDEPPESTSQPLNEPLDETKFVRLSIRGAGDNDSTSAPREEYTEDEFDDEDEDEDDDDEEEEEADEELWLPELRLIRKDDPEAHSFSTPQYSAHKLPRDVVDASASGEGLREFAKDWEKLLAKSQEDDRHVQSSDEE